MQDSRAVTSSMALILVYTLPQKARNLLLQDKKIRFDCICKAVSHTTYYTYTLLFSFNCSVVCDIISRGCDTIKNWGGGSIMTLCINSLFTTQFQFALIQLALHTQTNQQNTENVGGGWGKLRLSKTQGDKGTRVWDHSTADQRSLENALPRVFF